ncbi:MAG: hypothetical protein QM305_00615 [Bacteroidota bacterium]|nr:hypothetical protein [Bacteroidota bacterium]
MKRSVQLSKNSSIGVSLFMLLFLLLYPSTWAQKNTNPDPKVDKEFPLMAWDYVDDEKTLQEMKECGVNLVAFAPASLLDVAEKYNIKCILYDAGVLHAFDAPFNATTANSTLEELIRKYNDHPALYGYHLKDEPGVADFPELGKSVELVKKLAPGKWPYISLFPNFPFGDRYQVDYLEKFIDICQPTALSYNNYIPDHNSLDGAKSLFWDNLAEVRETALAADLPFWNIVLTSPHLVYEEFTDAELRLKMFGSLAYGAKGLSFYKFISAALPIYNAPDLGNFRMGPLDQFGERTRTFDALRNINRQIANMGPTLLALHSKAVYHIGDVPQGHHAVSEQSFVQEIPGGGRYIVGDFVDDHGAIFVMIVNKSITTSASCNPVFRVNATQVKIVSPWSGSLEEYPAGYFMLAPGQGVLLKLE